ncbi:MAG: putative Phospholipase [Promethearchaeota archaeon]|nr:MAG: putative Phospholipase [Candidatus Lokiarchaeota archaeon]
MKSLHLTISKNISVKYNKHGTGRNFIMFLHGAGVWSNVEEYLQNSHSIFGPKWYKKYTILFPLCKENQFWDNDELSVLLDEFDIDKVNLIGHSWGGRGVWMFASRYPKRIKTMVPISAVGCKIITPNIHKIPCYIAHGIYDKVVEFHHAVEMYRLLSCDNVTFHVLNRDHSICDIVINQEDRLFNWMELRNE